MAQRVHGRVVCELRGRRGGVHVHVGCRVERVAVTMAVAVARGAGAGAAYVHRRIVERRWRGREGSGREVRLVVLERSVLPMSRLGVQELQLAVAGREHGVAQLGRVSPGCRRQAGRARV